MKIRDEKKQIIFSTLIVTAISVVLVAVSLFGFKELNDAQNREAEQFLHEVTVQYKNTIVKQIEGDLQTLQALSTFIGQDEKIDLDRVLGSLEIENNRNKFVRMGFVSTKGVGYFLDINGDHYYDVDVSSEEVVKQALAGKNAVSRTVKDRFWGKDVIIYAVPLMQGEQVVGAVTATNLATTFSAIVSQTVFGGQGYAHVVDQSGDFIIRSNHKVIGEGIGNIFDTPEISGQLKRQVLTKTLDGKAYFGSFPYQNEEYWVALAPIGINDWFVFALVPQVTVNANFTKLIGMFATILGLLVLLFGVLFLYIQFILRKNRRSVERLAFYDSLTGAYNRSKFDMEAHQLISQNSGYVLAMVDVDNFKFVNELFGYKKGDELLIHAANVFARSAGEGELYYRAGADRFGLLLHYANREQLVSRIKQMLQGISAFSVEENQRYTIVCNCGVKIIEEFSKEVDLSAFIDRATMALKEAKGNHENTIAFYDDRMHARAQQKTKIEARMHAALENHEFVVYMQPKYYLKSGTLAGAEALVRWQTPESGMIYPDTFIPVFEQNGFITELDLYMLDEVCRVLRRWTDKGYPVVPVSVNQSRVMLYKKNYLDNLRQIIARHGIPASMIILEVTEGVAMGDIEEMEALIQDLHDIGFSVSMDDFGSGYSSLNILKELSIDELKLDKGFLAETRKAGKRDSIVRNVIKLARDLHITTVAEGIETLQQKETLLAANCDIGQGFYYARPMPLEEFVKLAFGRDAGGSSRSF